METKEIKSEIKMNNEMVLNELKIVKHFTAEQNTEMNKLNMNTKK